MIELSIHMDGKDVVMLGVIAFGAFAMWLGCKY